MAEETRKGGCHCGAVRYTVTIDLANPVIACNCSMCVRAGTLLSFVSPEQFNLDQGDEHLIDYQFNKHVIHHTFCKTCGIKSFAHGVGPKGPMVAINARCLDDVDVTTLDVTQFDGKSR
ncbi:MAG: GFA family protein [Deltaproteobacteria bacterium]|nr:GFA family protein [Deltaproteobacteria bacterium]